MSQRTRLEPLPPERARQVLAFMQQTGAGNDTALALDDDGRVLGIVGATDPEPDHVLGDLDVHA